MPTDAWDEPGICAQINPNPDPNPHRLRRRGLVRCEHCGTTENVSRTSSRTMYDTDLPENHPDNPNRDLHLCSHCAKVHHDYWDEQWSQARPSF